MTNAVKKSMSKSFTAKFQKMEKKNSKFKKQDNFNVHL